MVQAFAPLSVSMASISYLRQYVKLLNAAAARLNETTIDHRSGFKRAVALFESLKDRMTAEELASSQSARSQYEQVVKAPISTDGAAAEGKAAAGKKASFHSFSRFPTYPNTFRTRPGPFLAVLTF